MVNGDGTSPVDREDHAEGAAGGLIRELHEVSLAGERPFSERFDPGRRLTEETEVRPKALEARLGRGKDAPFPQPQHAEAGAHHDQRGGRGEGDPAPPRRRGGSPGADPLADDGGRHAGRVGREDLATRRLDRVDAGAQGRFFCDRPRHRLLLGGRQLAEDEPLDLPVAYLGHQRPPSGGTARNARSRFRTPDTDRLHSRATCSRVIPST